MRAILVALLFVLPAGAGQMSSGGVGFLAHFNEGTGTTTTDSVLASAGTITGAAWVDGLHYKGMYFPGPTNNNVAFAYNAYFPMSFAGKTVGMWLKQTSGVNCGYGGVSYGVAGNYGWYLVYDARNTPTNYIQMVFGVCPNAGCSGQVYKVFNPSSPHLTRYPNWTFLVATFDSGGTSYTAAKLHIYRNGIEETQTSASSGATSATTFAAPALAFDVGRVNGNSSDVFANTTLDEVFMVNRTMTRGEIQRIYTEGLGRHSRAN